MDCRMMSCTDRQTVSVLEWWAVASVSLRGMTIRFLSQDRMRFDTMEVME